MGLKKLSSKTPAIIIRNRIKGVQDSKGNGYTSNQNTVTGKTLPQHLFFVGAQ